MNETIKIAVKEMMLELTCALKEWHSDENLNSTGGFRDEKQ